MNKELIKKYKAEFEHWLAGGDILAKTVLGWTKVAKEYGWSSDVNVPHIIDDKYIKLRKATAEGKNVQFFMCGTWIDIKNPNYSEPVEYYRIKPEINLKVNDYVLNKDKQLCCINELINTEVHVYNYTIDKYQTYFGFDSVEPWVPEAGDLCWFSDSLNKEPILSRFNSIVFADSTKSEVSWYYAEHSDYNGKNYYKYCQPFIGQLPKGFKE